jgi:class 3 adenylate cyclase
MPSTRRQRSAPWPTPTPICRWRRGAVGYGPVYARGGDYFGTLVNLVARAVKVARPCHLVVFSEVVASLDHPEFTLGTPEEHTLRGIDRPIELIPVEVPGSSDRAQ